MASDTDIKTGQRRAWWRIMFGAGLLLVVAFAIGLVHGRVSGARSVRHEHHMKVHRQAMMADSQQIRHGGEEVVRPYARWVDAINLEHHIEAVDAPEHEHVRPQVALVSAYATPAHDVIQELASDTKAKYAGLHGYAYFYYLNPDLVDSDGAQAANPARMVDALLAHWDDADWLLWTETDVLFTDPDRDLQFILDLVLASESSPSSVPRCVLMPKNAMHRRHAEEEGISPAVMLVRTTPQARAFLEEKLRTFTILAADDSYAAADVTQLKEDPRVVLADQRLLNPYHNSKKLLKYEPRSESSLELQQGRALWEDGPACRGPGRQSECSFIVHVLCSNSEIDQHCCNGMAAFYHDVFMQRFATHAQSAPPYPASHAGGPDSVVPSWATACF